MKETSFNNCSHENECSVNLKFLAFVLKNVTHFLYGNYLTFTL